jgi:Ca2+-binding EF-hand superfamily protein
VASEFQRRKVAAVFDAMDVDSDGFLDESDFLALTDRWTETRDWPPGSPGHTRLTEIMMGWWAALVAVADANNDNKASLDEVMSVVDRLPGELHDAVVATANAMFDAIDENGDDRISADEYRQLIGTWTGLDTDTDYIFALMDTNGDGHLDRDEFIEHWTEFWAGDDPEAPGTWVFGRFE